MNRRSPQKKKTLSTLINNVFNDLQYYLFSDGVQSKNLGNLSENMDQKKIACKIKEKRFPGISLPFLYTFFEAAFQYLNPIFGGGSTLGNEVTSQLSCIQMYKTRV